MNIKWLFFESPTREYNVREVARCIKISPTTASSELKSLAKYGILKKKEEHHLILYRGNLESESYLDEKLFYNIRKLKESGLIEELNQFYLKPTIVLFGSASRGMDVENSDFDIVVISEKTSELPKRKEFEKKLNRQLQIFAVKDVKDLKNKHLINNVLNGIVLQGEVKWT